MQRTKCAYCKWHKEGGVWLSECTNKDSDWYCDMCCETDIEPIDCDYKMEE